MISGLRCALLLTLLLISCNLIAQDSTITIKRFNYDDLSSEKFEKYLTKSSTNRLAVNPDDLTLEVIIIDGEDIRKFGYSTLVDVLKTIPGFRTSQPGNAIEGETFLMRGLLGNDHTKILINGIPIKPEAVKSMPIAAQLPIRHAEYIEIVQGPSSATYGSDAMAGVINIVFPEIERPVFAWADVSGTTPATTEINLTLGGKAGAGENILNYEFFASSQRATDVNLLIPDDSIRLDPQTLNQYEQQFYVADKNNKFLPEINEMRRESRLIGTYLKFRWFELSAMNMFREEHSGFGNNPLTAAYYDPGSTYGENINSVGLKHVYSNNKHYQSRAAISVLTFKTLQNASYIATQDFLSNGRNFIYARSIDYRAEYQGIFKINNQFKFAFGTTGQYSISNPYSSHLGRAFHTETKGFDFSGIDLNPVTPSALSVAADSLSKIDSLSWIPKHTIYNVAAFGHFLYKAPGGKLNVEGAARIDYNSFAGIRLTPKIGVVYRPYKKLKIVANYGRGHRAPRSYHLYNNYWQSAVEWDMNGQQASFSRSKDSLRQEELQGGEVRVKWKLNELFTLSGRYYVHIMESRIIRERVGPPPPGVPILPEMKLGVGYFNANSYSFLNAFLAVAEFKKKFASWEMQALVSYEFANGWEQVEAEDNAPQSIERSAEYRFVPEHSLKANLNVMFKGFTFSIHNNYFGHYVTEIYRSNSSVQYDETNKYYYNLDILVHKNLFRQLSIFLGAYNVLNSVQSGIPASTVSSTWSYNPQYGRTFKLGLNFRLN